jgi:hypothetical protein
LGEPGVSLASPYLAVRVDLALQEASAQLGLHRRYFDLREIGRARTEQLPLGPYREQGLLFIHVPKCGGSSIEAEIGTFHGHRSATYFAHADQELFRALWKVALVRNPFDRLVSGFHYLKNHTNAPRDQRWAREVLGPIPDFFSFLRALESRRFRIRVLCWLHFLPQWFFLCDWNGRVLVDHVGHLDRFDAFSTAIGARIDRQIVGRREKASQHDDCQKYYTERTAAIVRNMYRRDFEIFGYPEDPGAERG